MKRTMKPVFLEIIMVLLLWIPASSSGGSGQTDGLDIILKKAAVYCEKLKGAAFHFICQEAIAENRPLRQVSPTFAVRPKKTRWVYDYQIVSKDGKISEQRTLLKMNRKSMNLPNAQLESRFCSLYTFYIPVTLLAREKQASLSYRLEGWEKINKRRAARLGIDSQGPTRVGKAWVDPVNGSVLKVALDQNAVQGFEELKKKAEAMGETLSVSDTHWYAVEKGGLCFPSRTEINEVYSFDGRFLRVTGQVSLVKTIFSYSRYRFFSISTQVTEDVGSEQSSPPVK